MENVGVKQSGCSFGRPCMIHVLPVMMKEASQTLRMDSSLHKFTIYILHTVIV